MNTSPRDEEAKRPDEANHGPATREPKATILIDILPVFRWLKKTFTKKRKTA